MIPILCQSCDQHVLWLDPLKLAWPLTGEMFTAIEPNYHMPSGKIGTDGFHCGVCFSPIFRWNAGTGVMGEWLNVRGADGRPKLIKTSDLIEKWKNVPRAKVLDANEKRNLDGSPYVAGASGQGSTKKVVKGRRAKTRPNPTGKTFTNKGHKPAPLPPEIKQVMNQVQQGQSEEPAAVTKDELLTERQDTERERNALSRRTANLRPAEGYQAPK